MGVSVSRNSYNLPNTHALSSAISICQPHTVPVYSSRAKETTRFPSVCTERAGGIRESNRLHRRTPSLRPLSAPLHDEDFCFI